jgi:2-polyprenyl-3-methyl-5-hydroxy-6-metoxy-1,4-benzoquinol methylase
MKLSGETDTVEQTRGWEYAKIGDYHRDLDPNWSYTPTYLRKMSILNRFLQQLPKKAVILDAGCGEGVLVQEMRGIGLDIHGIDLNYGSPIVTHGNILKMPYGDANFDVVLLLDVFEHLTFEDQPKALCEVLRVLKPSGQMVASIPNLAHWNSRNSMFFRGVLDRTDIETNHVGERPMRENLRLLKEAGFSVNRVVGVTLTVPWLYRQVICKHAARCRWLHDLCEPLAQMVPGWAMLDIFFCRKT